MEEARRALFERVIKKYTMQEVVKHRSYGSGQRSLIELISRYPSHGLHFKVFKKTWHEGSFYHVRRTDIFVSHTSASMFHHIAYFCAAARTDATVAYGVSSMRTDSSLKRKWSRSLVCSSVACGNSIARTRSTLRRSSTLVMATRPT